MCQYNLYTSYDKYDLDNLVFEDHPFSKDFDDTSIVFDKELYKSVILDDVSYHPYRSKFVTEKHNHKPKCSKGQSFKELFD